MNCNVYLDSDLAHKIEAYASDKKMSRNGAIRELIAAGLKKTRGWPAGLFDPISEEEGEFPSVEELRSVFTEWKPASL